MESKEVVKAINGVFIIYTLMAIFAILEVYQTAVIIKLTRALDANSGQNSELLELNKGQDRKLIIIENLLRNKGNP